MPLNAYTGSASAATNQMSARADRSGQVVGSAVPSSSLVDTRPERMPPRAPALLRWAGTSTSSAGYWSNSAKRFSRAVPASVLSVAAANRIGSDSRTIRRRSSSRLRAATTTIAIEATDSTIAEAVGDEVDPDEAGGQPQRRKRQHVTQHADDRGGDAVEVPVPAHRARRSAAAWPPSRRSTPARRRRSRSRRGRARRRCPRSRGRRRRPSATTAMPTERPAVRTAAASRFWPSTVSRRSDSRKVPAWMAVEMRLPKAPKMLPRSPMAAGTSTSSPGTRAKVAVIDPSTPPATKLVALFSPRAARLCRALGPRVLRRRSTNRPMPEVWSRQRSPPGDGPRRDPRPGPQVRAGRGKRSDRRRAPTAVWWTGPVASGRRTHGVGAGGPGRVSALVRASLRRASAVRNRKRAGGQSIGPNDGTVHIDGPRSLPGRRPLRCLAGGQH